MSILNDLVAVVQYRRRPAFGPDWWHTIAAFDVRCLAEDYARDCASGASPHKLMLEYRVVDVHRGEEVQ